MPKRITPEEINEQHEHIRSVIDSLQLARTSGEGAADSDLVFAYLLRYLLMHFLEEELLMDNSGYPNINAHRQEHMDFAHKLTRLRASIESGEVDLLACVRIVQGWHDDHILGFDSQYESWSDDK
jgi:hemerythrin